MLALRLPRLAAVVFGLSVGAGAACTAFGESVAPPALVGATDATGPLHDAPPSPLDGGADVASDPCGSNVVLETSFSPMPVGPLPENTGGNVEGDLKAAESPPAGLYAEKTGLGGVAWLVVPIPVPAPPYCLRAAFHVRYPVQPSGANGFLDGPSITAEISSSLNFGLRASDQAYFLGGFGAGDLELLSKARLTDWHRVVAELRYTGGSEAGFEITADDKTTSGTLGWSLAAKPAFNLGLSAGVGVAHFDEVKVTFGKL